MADNPYVFISYAHLDSDTVIPCVNAMKGSGINLWYDEGIEAGSEWPEFIAEKVVGCSKFVLFVSKAYLNSQNCKRELNFAISRKKDILSIFIEDVNLSPGMEMQLGTYQTIYRKRFASDAAFRDSLSRESFFNTCRSGGVPNTLPKPTAYTNSYTNSGQSFSGTYSKPATDTAYNDSYSRSSQSNTSYSYTTPAPKPDYSLALPVKNKYVAALLAIFLGCFGVHKFYLKQTNGALFTCSYSGLTFPESSLSLRAWGCCLCPMSGSKLSITVGSLNPKITDSDRSGGLRLRFNFVGRFGGREAA